mmetsp:Transcript_2975/g.6539  ORF Transcript_2975/g.6539 Transcript_2975/m.6539 type:complete len:1324 (-) Transcript_2975:261-4232(-)
MEPEADALAEALEAEMPEEVEAQAEEPVAAAGEQEAAAEEPAATAGEQQEAAAAEPLVAPVEEKKAPTSRLMIRQVVLENFKSYGGRKVIGPFNKSFSSIVGPNGSGKSNTIDALLFVFGKRAKKMRLNKISELIHKSSTIPDPGSARVEVTFQDIIDTGDGPEDYKIVEGSVLTVAREAFKNNTSKYLLDGRASNFSEVTTLLRKRGVDLEHNRFLILQGEVEQISLMKPKAPSPHEDGLLEYLEDIIGSNRLVEPIEQAEQVVEQLTEQRQEKLNRLRVAERERDNLEGPRKEAQAWITMEAERLELQAVAAQYETYHGKAKLKDREEEHKALESRMQEHKQKMEEFESQVKEIEGSHNGVLKEYNDVKAQMEKAAEDFKECEKIDVKLTEDIEFKQQKLVECEKTAEEEKKTANKLRETAEESRKEAPECEKALAKAEKKKAALSAALEEVYASLKGKAEELRVPKEQKEAELVPLQKQLTEVRKVVEVAQTEAQLIRDKTVKVTDEIEGIKTQHAECTERLKTRQQEIKEAGKLRKDREKMVAEAEDRLKKLLSQMDGVSKEVASARAKVEECKSAFEKEHDRGRLISAVYQQSKAGKLQGVHGRLGDLGTIDKKYDVAVSTACGMLDAIVVDTTEDAQGVIDFIRTNRLGRTTCICLDQMKRLESELGPTKTPDNIPRLIDLIKPNKEAYRTAFFFAVRHTIVAKDLEQATRVALQGRTRWRTVTLEGQLVDTSGTMSGGGHSVAKGGMRASVCQYSQEEMKGFVETYEKVSKQMAGMQQECSALEEGIRLTRKEIADFELQERKCTMDIESTGKQIEAYDARLKTLKVPTTSAEEKKKLKELEKVIASKSGELNDIQSRHSAVEQEVRELHNQIMNIGGEQLKNAKQNLETQMKTCEELRKEARKLILDADNMEKNAVRADNRAKALLDERAATEKAINQLQKDHKKNEDKAEAVLIAYNTAKEALAEKDQVLAELRGKRDAVLNAARDLKSQEVDLVNELEEKTRLLRDLCGRINAWTGRLEEARKEHKELPMDLVLEGEGESDKLCDELGRKAITGDLDEEDLSEVVREDVDARMAVLEENLKGLKPNLAVIEEFRRADSEHKTRLSEYDSVHSEREESRRKLEELRHQRLEEFMEGFSVISMKLKEMYQMITLGGDAELELVDSLDPFSEGINFSVRPPKKSWKQITNLSGGEKTLASLSLVFALHHYKPTPLYFMDEIDAALDFRNVSIIANYIKERTKNAQFIVISLRNHMFELADLLVGIYKTQDVSKSVAIDPTAFVVQTRAPLTGPGHMAPLQDKKRDAHTAGLVTAAA